MKMYTLNIDGGYSINFCITEEIDDKTIKKIERICNKISKAHTEDLKTLTLVRTQSGQKRGIVENLFNEFTQKVKNESNMTMYSAFTKPIKKTNQRPNILMDCGMVDGD